MMVQGELKDQPAWWIEALQRREQEANEKMERGQDVDHHDVTAVALMHPEAYEVAIRGKS